jgi:hypothetical protein
MWRSNYLPPMTRALRGLGLAVRPPHYYSFFFNALMSGTDFAIFWGLAMWFLAWSGSGMSWYGAMVGAMFAGLLFGLTMAWYYSHSARKHNLSSWEGLSAG